jgi:hypothetical protein
MTDTIETDIPEVKDPSAAFRMEAFRARTSEQNHWPAHISGRHGVLTPEEKAIVLEELKQEHENGNQPLLSWLIERVSFFIQFPFALGTSPQGFNSSSHPTSFPRFSKALQKMGHSIHPRADLICSSESTSVLQVQNCCWNKRKNKSIF